MDREFSMVFQNLCGSQNPRSVWDDFITLSAVGISNVVDCRTDRDEQEESLLEKYTNQEKGLIRKLFNRTADVLARNPNQDYLGNLFLDLCLGVDGEEENLMPYSEAVEKTTFYLGLLEARPFASLGIPHCGSGAEMIAAFNQMNKINMNPYFQLFCVAYERNSTFALMSYIQMSLIGISGYVVNYSKKGMRSPLSLVAPENSWCTPAYFHRTWQARRLAQYVMDL